jgi:uncharacterized protein
MNRGFDIRARKNDVKLTQEAAIERGRQFVSEIQLGGVSLSHAILFGSYARNEQRDYSKINIALVSERFQGLAIVDVEPFRDIKIKPHYVMFEIHTYNTANFERGGNSFIDGEIKPKGIVIL